MPTLARRFGATTTELGYGSSHDALRARFKPIVLAGDATCWRCGERIIPGEPWHLGHSDDRSRYMGPEHQRCNLGAAGRAGAAAARRRMVLPEVEPERAGLEAADRRWQVPWLRSLVDVPRDATWPRLMTVPHPDATGSLGEEFSVWAHMRTGKPLRWWQQLVAARLLEHDRDGRLVWETLLLTLARQLGKSWLLRELCMWRIHQGETFGDPQIVLHVASDLKVSREVQRPARLWASERRETYRVREANGREEIEYRRDGSRWMLGSKQQGGYGFSVDFAPVDEVWKVEDKVVEEGLEPTMVEREQAQLMLISTAHRLATPLMIQRRAAALEHLESAGGDLLIEWSAPQGAAITDRDGWRMASPYWTPKRERLIARKLELVQAGEVLVQDEVDPEASLRTQYLNQWPSRPVGGADMLLPTGLWARLEGQVEERAPWFVAVEDGFGKSAAVAACCQLDDGRFQVDGWRCDNWDAALFDVRRLALVHRIQDLQVGASMLSRVPADMNARSVGTAETRPALVLLRDLATGGMLVHDDTAQLDVAVNHAQVKQNPSGLTLVTCEDTHLVKAMVWALAAAHKPAPIGGVY